MAYRRESRLSSPLTAKASTKRPFRAWFDPEKVRFASEWCQAGSLGISFSGQKSYFPAQTHVGVFELLSNITAARVSVLDLDNMFVSTQYT